MKPKSLILVGLSVIVLLLAACAQQAAPPQPAEKIVTQVVEKEVTTVVEVQKEVTTVVEVVATPDRSTDPRFGGTFKPAARALVQFDQALSSDGPSFEAMSLIHGYLYRMQDFGDPIPDIAESWEWKNDTTLVFHLRHGVMFQDGNEVFPEGQGREVTADDVVYSMERWATLPGSKITSDVKDVYDSIEAVDKYTVQLNLKKPSGGLFDQVNGLSNLAIIPHEAVEHYGDDFGKHPVGSGPFEFVEYVPDDHLLVKRNEDYWLQCFLDEIYLQIIPDDTVALVALEAGDVDFVSNVPGAEVDRIATDKRFNIYYRPSKTPRMIMFPSGVQDFQDKRFRQAIAVAIDSQANGPAVYGAVAEPGCGNLSKGLPGHVADLCEKYFPYDPEQAKALFAELGWTDSNSDGVLDKDGKPMEPIKVNTFNIAGLDKVLEIVVTQLKAVGVPAEPELVEFGTWSDMYISGAEDSQTNERRLMLWAGCGGPGGLQLCWAKDASFGKVLGYNDSKVFDLVAQANETVDTDKRDGILQQAEEKLFGDYWVINATGPVGALMASRKYVKDYGSRYHFDNVCTLNNNVWLDKQK
ncbi:MAG: ABC transporter substrate-binding protein [Ardenticatenaceae bacterium]|nr:ABC transporter substrate-binding protein [Ardenticatenaceae bacterium]